jgi:GNAT superfamily N-acetyltransferase
MTGTPGEITVRHDLRPGDMGRVIALHGELYTAEFGYSPAFEAYVAESFAEFGKRYDPARDRLWLAEIDGRLVGSIGILGRDHEEAQLRWFLVHPSARGRGLGQHLLRDALQFCRGTNRRSVYLWTVTGLDASARMYASVGFRLTEQMACADMWGVRVAEQRYDLELN